MTTRQLHAGIVTLLLALLTTPLLRAQAPVEDKDDLEFGIKAGLNVGATTPLPKPKAIDKIYTWNPLMNIAIKGWLSYHLPDTKGWHLDTGLEMERKGMYVCTHATDMRINIGDGQEAAWGLFTGNNSTEFINYYLTLPMLVAYHTSKDKFRMQVGFYLSYLMQQSFKVTLDGDGTLNGDPISPDHLVDYDLSDHFNKLDMGVRVGFDYFFHQRLGVTAQLNMSFEPALDRSFTMMPFPLYNIYAFAGFAYRI